MGCWLERGGLGKGIYWPGEGAKGRWPVVDGGGRRGGCREEVLRDGPWTGGKGWVREGRRRDEVNVAEWKIGCSRWIIGEVQVRKGRSWSRGRGPSR